MLVSRQVCDDIRCHVGVASFEKSWEVEGDRKDNQRKDVESGFLPCRPAWVANAQESLKGDGDGGVDGASEANVEKRIGDLVDHSVDVRVGVAGQGTVAKDRAIAEDEEEVK